MCQFGNDVLLLSVSFILTVMTSSHGGGLAAALEHRPVLSFPVDRKCVSLEASTVQQRTLQA